MGEENRWIEKVMLKIPGFKGYKQKELLREDDRLIRNYIHLKIKNAEQSLRMKMEDALAGNFPITIEKLDKIVNKMNSLATKVRTAPAGYAGLFNKIKVKEEELNQIMDMDKSLVETADEIERICGDPMNTADFEKKLLDLLNKIETSMMNRDNFWHTKAS